MMSTVIVTAVMVTLAPAATTAPRQVGSEPTAPAPAPHEPFNGASLMPRWIEAAEALDAAGFSVAVVGGGRVLYSAAWGLADPVRERPMTVGTVAYIASTTKSFTAMVVLDLAAEGLIDLDAPVSRYIPEFTLQDPGAAERVTIRGLLSHNAGLRPPPPVVLGTSYTGNLDTDGVIALLPMTGATFRYGYDNIHYILLGEVIERVTGRAWGDEIRRRLLEPAGMTGATPSIDAMRRVPDHADSWSRGTSGWFPGEPRKCQATLTAAGSLSMSARDLARWALLNLGRGEIDGVRVLSPGVVEASWAREAQSEPNDRLGLVQDGYSLGWERATFAGHDVVMHTGDFPGCHAHVSFVPGADVGVVVLVNSGTPSVGWVVASDVYRTVLAPDSADPVPDRIATLEARKAERRAEYEPPAPDHLLGAGQLSLDLSAYEGDYSDPMLGTLTVRAGGGHVHAVLGGPPAAPAGHARARFGRDLDRWA